MSDQENDNNKSLTRIIGEGIALYSIGSFLNKFSGLATSLIKIKLLTVFHYGLLSLTTTAIYFFNGLVTMGMSDVVTADLNRAKGEERYDKYKALLYGYFKAVCLLAVIFWALLFFGIDFITSYYENSVLPFIKIFSFVILLSPLRVLYTVLFQTHLKFKYIVNRSIIESYVNLGLVIVFVWVMGLGIKGVIYAELIYHTLTLILYTPFFIKIGSYLLQYKRSPKNYFWQILKNHGKWAIFTSYLGDFTKKIRPWFIALFLNVEAVAIFSVAQSFFHHLTSLLPISSVLAQIFPQQIKNKVKVGEIFHRSFKYSLYIFLVIGIGGLLLVPSIVSWLFPRYTESLPVLLVFLLSMPIMALTVLQTPIYNAMQRQKDIFVITIGNNVLMTVLSVLLIPVLGIMGGAVESVITIYFYAIARYKNMKRIAQEIHIDWKNLFVIDEVDREVLKKVFLRLKRIKSWEK